jgi:hypothetical protein
MASEKVVLNLATRHEDSERMTIAFLVATAAQAQEQERVNVLDQGRDPARPALDADAIEAAGRPPVTKLFARPSGGPLGH